MPSLAITLNEKVAAVTSCDDLRFVLTTTRPTRKGRTDEYISVLQVFYKPSR